MITYKKSGVDVQTANQFIGEIASAVHSTRIKGVIGQIGGFGALFEGRFSSYKNPVLVSSTDGVGTKLKIAQLVGKHDTVGIDLVAMNVNDILCVGARPLFFLDYIACGKLDICVLSAVVRGIVRGCRQAGCALIGGETAEMPGMYSPQEYDLAGFSVGIVERSKLIDGRKISPGDHLIGLTSSGLHSNGYSLVRKVFSQREQRRLAKELLKPTQIYTKPVLKVLSQLSVRGIAHITGGSFKEKLGRIIPKGLQARIHRASWQIPSIFRRIQANGVSENQMYCTFNMGIGLVIVVGVSQVKQSQRLLFREGIRNWIIGEVARGEKGVVIL